jgi:DNA polymerase phi
MSTTLPLFWHLSSTSKQERINASVKLIGALEEFQSQFVPAESPAPSSNEGDDEGSKPDVLDALNAQDVSYSIRRLVRGLASPRQCSRLGFAVALSEVRILSTFVLHLHNSLWYG